MTDDDILKYIGKHLRIGRERLAKELNIPESKARTLLKLYHAQKQEKTGDKAIKSVSERLGLTAEQILELLAPKKESITVKQPRKTRHFRFAVISDTHLSDKSCDIESLHNFYALLQSEGITDVVHAGDMTAGHEVYGGQFNDLRCHGFADQLSYAVQNYPEFPGIITYFIDGNHDASFKKQAGVEFGDTLGSKRQDLLYCGLYAGNIELNGVKIKLQHGGGGAAYAKSYKLQKYVEQIGGGEKPQILVLGHYHDAIYMSYRNIHCLKPACWQKPNDFSIRYGLPNTVGGFIIDLQIAEDEHNSIDRFRAEFVQYY